MRRIAIFLVMTAAAAIPFASVPAAAETAREALESRGRIESVVRQRPEDVRIRDASGRSRIAQPNDYLARGDHVLLAGGGTRVRLYVKGRRGLVTLNGSQTADFAVNGPPPSSLMQKAADFLNRFNFVFADRQGNALTSTSGRLDDEEPSGPPYPVAAGMQRIAPRTVTVTFAWKGAADEVHLRRADGTQVRRLKVNRAQALDVPIAPSLSDGELVATGPGGTSQPLRFTRTSGPVPAPTFLQPGAAGEDASLIHALWLASDGPDEWRLEGLSRLAELARTDYAAAKVMETYRH